MGLLGCPVKDEDLGPDTDPLLWRRVPSEQVYHMSLAGDRQVYFQRVQSKQVMSVEQTFKVAPHVKGVDSVQYNPGKKYPLPSTGGRILAFRL